MPTNAENLAKVLQTTANS